MLKTFVFKFGGASVKDAPSIINLSKILYNRLRNHTVIVVSAMGKTTNALESILEKKIKGEDFSLNITILKNYHLDICSELFEPEHSIHHQIENHFIQLDRDLQQSLRVENFDQYYDQIILYGELLATRIVQEYLCSVEIFCVWQDARELIQTNADYRFAKVDWKKTTKNIKNILAPILTKFPVVTQGFIGREKGGSSTTLGREGSDFTAAILGACLKSHSVTIWKDVAGVLNADPKRFPNAVKFDELDYQEAAELTYYGASVIHPKTIKPLANLSIPLYVKSFLAPEESGTRIHHIKQSNHIPCIVLKEDQILVSFKVTDFTFIEEKHIHQVYAQLEQLKLKVNMLQTSAISISIVIDKQPFKLDRLIEALSGLFEIRYNEALQLITIKNHNPEIINQLMEQREVLMEQVTRSTFQMVAKPLQEAPNRPLYS
ncbi:aspartate kinase [Cecembia lonarensis]|uniref:Aspartokinase n=1 Tax=Cecembia lonarensis (strain CCUG 58316 / KCTC 22772 / LW9) TaxID=1225176 RepID=K1L786_CECL9|nr:aspartate kinase [Cecembia lonarensis]EKB50611.1 Lysine-sensitive aspartokinase 3 [Cecembia lonarensis LW9]